MEHNHWGSRQSEQSEEKQKGRRQTGERRDERKNKLKFYDLWLCSAFCPVSAGRTTLNQMLKVPSALSALLTFARLFLCSFVRMLLVLRLQLFLITPLCGTAHIDGYAAYSYKICCYAKTLQCNLFSLRVFIEERTLCASTYNNFVRLTTLHKKNSDNRDERTLADVWTEIGCRLDVCCGFRGNHIEHLET